MLQPPFCLPSKVRMFWVIRFHPSHRLFSRLRNHSTVSLTIPLGDLSIYFLFIFIFCAYFEQFSLSSPDVNKNKGVAETVSLMWLPDQYHGGLILSWGTPRRSKVLCKLFIFMNFKVFVKAFVDVLFLVRLLWVSFWKQRKGCSWMSVKFSSKEPRLGLMSRSVNNNVACKKYPDVAE